MTTYQKTPPTHLARHQSGVSLIIVLIMLVIIGLTSAAAIRNATSGEKVTNNIRLQNLAQQYAEAALRYCEVELGKLDTLLPAAGGRVVSLADANIVTVAVGGATVWGNGASWLGGVGAAASMTNLPESQIKSSDSSFTPSKLPQCVVERQTLADGTFAHVVTARGFSPDYTADSTTGVTTNGSVVWLQSTLLLQ